MLPLTCSVSQEAEMLLPQARLQQPVNIPAALPSSFATVITVSSVESLQFSVVTLDQTLYTWMSFRNHEKHHYALL